MQIVRDLTRITLLAFTGLCVLSIPLTLEDAFCQEYEDEIAVEHGYIRVQGDQLFYDLAGQGRPLVLLHDGLLHRATWDEQFAAFAKHFQVVRYDRRGYGRSSRPREPYSNVDDLLTLMDSLRIERAILMGCSSGGGLAIDFALEHPDRTAALVLVGAVVSGLEYSEHFQTRGGRWAWSEEMIVEDVIQYWAMVDPFEIAPHNLEVKERVKQLLSVNTQNLDVETQRLRQGPMRPAVTSLSEIKVPVLIVVGEHDIADIHAHAGAIEAGIFDAWRVVIAGCGHLVHMEAPTVFNGLVLDFLKEPEWKESTD